MTPQKVVPAGLLLAGNRRVEGKARVRRGGQAVFLAAFAVLLLLMAAPGRAETNPAPYSLTPFVGGYTFDGGEDLETSPVFGARFGYDFSRTWGLEGVFHYVPAESDGAGASDTDVFNYRIDALYHFLPGSRFVPFLAAGIGFIDHRPEVGGDEAESAFNYGAGLKYYLSDRMLVRGDIRHLIWLEDPHHSNFEYTLSLGFLFGAGKAAPAPPPPPPPPAPKPTISLAAEPDSIERGRCATLTWSSTDADTVSFDPGIGAAGTRGSRQVCPSETTRYTATAAGKGGKATASETVTVTAPPPPPKPAPPADSDGDGVIDDRDKCPGTPRGTAVDKDGCPLPETVSIRLLVEFDTGKSDIKPKYRDEIARVGEFMKKYPWTTAVIEGHTDNVGGAKYNKALSQRRAEAVRKSLIDTFGIEPNRLTAKGYGLEKPVADNGTPEGRQKNRRIEAQITTKTRP